MKTKKMNKKQLSLLISLVLLCTVTIGVTLAYIVDQTDPVENKFNPSYVTCEVDEDFTDNVKKDVSIKNTSDIDAYIRAKVVVTWQAADGNIAAEKPVAGTDYSISFANGTDWDLETTDGYYYYEAHVKPEENTDILISECKPLKAGPDGYTLHVEIIADAIQSTPADAVTEAWGVTVYDNGIISK